MLVLIGLGVVDREAVVYAGRDLWRSFVALAAIMVMTEVAMRVGLLDAWATRIEASARTISALFARVFILGAVVATTLNNDAAILLLTPLVVSLVHRRYPDRPDLVVPFAFAVFMSAGVAPLMISNPMNMIVAEYAGIGFNNYASHMALVAIAGWVTGFIALRYWFRGQLNESIVGKPQPPQTAMTGPQLQVMILLASVLAAIPDCRVRGRPRLDRCGRRSGCVSWNLGACWRRQSGFGRSRRGGMGHSGILVRRAGIGARATKRWVCRSSGWSLRDYRADRSWHQLGAGISGVLTTIRWRT